MGKWSKFLVNLLWLVDKIYCARIVSCKITRLINNHYQSIQCLNEKNDDQCADMKIRFCCPLENAPKKTLAIITGGISTIHPETEALKNWLLSKVETLKTYDISITTYEKLEPMKFTEMTEAYGALEMLTQAQDSGFFILA